MMTAWTRTLALGLLLWPLACEVSVNGGDDDGGSGGDGGRTAGGGRDGSGARSGSSGTSGSGGSAGEATAPTCDPEPIDEDDACVQCFKEKCCTEWLGCDDSSCTEEWISVSECLEPQEFAGEDELGMCISEASEAGDGFVQPNTQDLINCALRPADDAGVATLCSFECFGSDIYLE